MAISFTKLPNGNVIISSDDIQISVPSAATLRKETHSIVIRWDTNRVLIYHPEVSAPITANIDELFTVLSTDFFFSPVSGGDISSYIFKLAYYEEITAVSGQITKPEGATILLDQWAGGVDAVVSAIVGGKPDFEDTGVDVNSFDVDGNYALSGALPSNPAALIFYLSISLADYGNLDINHIITYAELQMAMPIEELDVLNKISLAGTDYVISDSGNIDAYGIRMISFADGTLYDMLTPNRVSIDFVNRILQRMWTLQGTTNDGTTNLVEGKNSDNATVFKVDTNGFELDQYDDLLPSAQWLATNGAPGPDLVTATIGGVVFSLWAFDGANTTESMTSYFEVVHGIDIDALNASTLLAEVHTHGMPSTTAAGVVKIFFSITYLSVNAAPEFLGTFSVLIPISTNQQYWHKLGGIEIPKPAAGYGIGDQIMVKYERKPTDTQDTYNNADWLFLQCALHMPFNSRGSRQRYAK